MNAMLLPENYSLVRQSLEVVGLTVFHTLWAGGLLLLLLMLVLRIMPTQLAKARFAVSLAALQLLFLIFLGVFFYQCHQLSPAFESADKIAAAPGPPPQPCFLRYRLPPPRLTLHPPQCPGMSTCKRGRAGGLPCGCSGPRTTPFNCYSGCGTPGNSEPRPNGYPTIGREGLIA